MKISNECNMELMSRYKDNHFDLAIVDPPYMNNNTGLKSNGIARTQYNLETFNKPKKIILTNFLELVKIK